MAEPRGNGGTDRRWWYAVGAAVVLLLVVGALVFLAADDDGDTTAGPGTTTTTEEPDTTTSSTSATSTTETTATTAPVDTTTAVFPFAGDGPRFGDPVEAVEYWAEGILGFVDPVYSEFREGDSRSGEVVVQPTADGPETTVFVRQLDETWWILGAAAQNIEVDEPEALATLTSPVTVSGRALAFEGNVEVELWTDAADGPLAMVTVTGGGDELRAFEGTLTFDGQPQTPGGALILRSRSAEDGSTWEASVLRVRF